MHKFKLISIILLIPIFAIACASITETQQPNFYDEYSSAIEDTQNGDLLAAANTFIELANALPQQPRLQLAAAEGWLHKGDLKEAIPYLEKIAAYGFGYDLENRSEFKNYLNDPDIINLIQKYQSNLKPEGAIHSIKTFTTPNIIAEGVAADKKTKAIYVSDLYQLQLIKMDADGTEKSLDLSQLTTQLLGLDVDEKNGHVWLCGTFIDERQGLIKISSSSFQVISTHPFPISGSGCNDVTVDDQVFATDNVNGRIFIIDKNDQAVAIPLRNLFFYPNGLHYDAENHNLVVASAAGLSCVNTKDFSTKAVALVADISLSGIDGLAFNGDRFIGVQNAATQTRIVTGLLEHTNCSISDFEVLTNALDSDIPLPTTVFIEDGLAWLIANSEFELLENGELVDNQPIQPFTLKAIQLP